MKDVVANEENLNELEKQAARALRWFSLAMLPGLPLIVLAQSLIGNYLIAQGFKPLAVVLCTVLPVALYALYIVPMLLRKMTHSQQLVLDEITRRYEARQKNLEGYIQEDVH